MSEAAFSIMTSLQKHETFLNQVRIEQLPATTVYSNKSPSDRGGKKKNHQPTTETNIIVSKVVLKTVSETFKSQCNHFGNRKLKRAWRIRVLLIQIASSNLSQIPPAHFSIWKG